MKQEKKEKTNIVYVGYSSYCVHSKEPKEKFGDWEADYESNLNYISIKKPIRDTDIFPVGVNFNPEEHTGKRVFAVTVTYSEGDTFGRSSGLIQCAGVYLTEEEAIEDEKLVLSGEHENNYLWYDYFGRVEYTDIKTFILA